jgi:hypothetical protein
MESNLTEYYIKQAQNALYMEYHAFSKSHYYMSKLCYLPAKGVDVTLESLKIPLSAAEKIVVATYNLLGTRFDDRCNIEDAVLNMKYVYMNMTSLPVSVLLDSVPKRF